MDKRIIFRRIGAGIAACVLIFGFTSCSGQKEAKVQMKADHILVDKLQNAERYYGMNPGFEKAFTFLGRSDLAELPAGTYKIDDDRIFCMISKGPGKTRAEAKLEAHRKYIDIQYIITGKEQMGYKPTDKCKLTLISYDPDRDIMFFNDKPDSWTTVRAGSFAIFFPKDAHAPMVSKGEIHKAVIKVAVEQNPDNGTRQ
jgi:biofilm protein TabA